MRRKKETPVTPAKLTDQQVLMRQLASLVSQRRELANSISGMQFQGQRDLYEVLGYNRDPGFQDYLASYERDDIAARIIDAKPESTWRRRPTVSEDKDATNHTKFEQQWIALVHRRSLFQYFERADKISGIGRYGILYIGANDVRSEKDLVKPLGKLRGGIDSIVNLCPYGEGCAEIASIDSNSQSTNYGMPEFYLLDTSGDVSGSRSRSNKVEVHWTRIIHIAENRGQSEIYGTPRLRAVYNRLFDVAKIAGGSAELFWQAAKRIMILEAKEGYTAVDEDDKLTEMMDELVHGLRRTIDLNGYTAKVLENSDIKPDEAFRVCLALISSATGIPQRILLGSEQGKMASTQDEVNWNGRIADRQLNYAEPVILRPFIDRLITAGALPAPKNEYSITWPSLFELSDKEKAQIGLLKARTIAQYIGTNGGILPFAEKIVGIDELRSELLNLKSVKIEQSIAKTGDQSSAPDGQPAVPSKKATKKDNTERQLIEDETI